MNNNYCFRNAKVDYTDNTGLLHTYVVILLMQMNGDSWLHSS